MTRAPIRVDVVDLADPLVLPPRRHPHADRRPRRATRRSSTCTIAVSAPSTLISAKANGRSTGVAAGRLGHPRPRLDDAARADLDEFGLDARRRSPGRTRAVATAPVPSVGAAGEEALLAQPLGEGADHRTERSGVRELELGRARTCFRHVRIRTHSISAGQARRARARTTRTGSRGREPMTRPLRRERSAAGGASSSWPGSGRRRSPAWCSPTSAPRSSASTGRPPPRHAGFASTGDVMGRGKRSVAIDLKQPDGVELVLDLCADVDVLIEGFRPGVTERLGVGPDAVPRAQPRAGLRPDDGIRAGRPAGAGARATTSTTSRSAAPSARSAATASRRRRRSTSSATSAVAACCSWWACSARCCTPARSGEGQVVDAAMVDGTALLMAPLFPVSASGGRAGGAASSTRAPRSTTCTRPPTASTCRSGRSSRSSTPTCWRGRGSTRRPRRPDGQRRLAGGQAARGRRVPHEDARRVVRACSRAPTPA